MIHNSFLICSQTLGEQNRRAKKEKRNFKTMLLHHVFSQLDQKSCLSLYMDLFATRSLVHIAQ